MAYKKEDMIKQCLSAIEENDLIYQYEIFSYVKFSQRTFQTHKLQELQEIKNALIDSAIRTKVGLRKDFRNSKSATERIALYRMLATPEEFERLVMNQIDYTSKGEKIQPIEFTIANPETKNKIKKLIDEAMLN